MKLPAFYYLVAFLLSLGCTGPDASQQQSGLIKLDSANIYYESQGKGETVLLLHAGFLNTDMWDKQTQKLAKHYRVIAIDIPGHGRTENDTFRIEPAVFIKGVLDSLHIQQASLIGVSLGASCVTDFVIAHPERVNKAILVSSGINGWEHHFKLDTMITQYLTSLFGALKNRDTTGAAEVFTRFWFDGPFRSPQQVNDTVRQYIYETVLGNMKKHKINGWPLFAEPPAIDNLSTIKRPLLIIDGDKDLPYIGQACTYIQQNVAGAKRITIAGTGHMLNLEAPDAFNKAVIDFLKQ